MLDTRCETTFAAVDPQAWDALVGEGSPFLEHAFLHALEIDGAVGPGTGWDLRLVTVHDAGRLAGGVVAWVKDHSFGEFVYDWRLAAWAQGQGLAWYPKLVVGVPFTPVTGRRLLVADGLDGEGRRAVEDALLAALDEVARGCVSVNVLFPTTEDATSLARRGWAERIQVQYHWTNHGYRGFEDALGALPSKRRTSIRKERAGHRDLDVRVVDGSYPGLATRLAAFYAGTAERYTGEPGYVGEAFFAAYCRRAPSRVRAVLALEDGVPFAGTFNVCKGDRLYGRWWGADQERPFLHFEVALYRAMDWCIANGVRVFEPGHGGEHKLARGFVPTVVRSCHKVRHAGADGALRRFYAHEADAVRQAYGV
ncbi:MAG: hypothetical protein RLZZ299_2264 [Pseudomonadota bacterium]|jgi:predicted N-acyltransferase